MPISLCQQLDVPSRLKAGKLPRWDDHEITSSGVVRCLVEAVLKKPIDGTSGTRRTQTHECIIPIQCTNTFMKSVMYLQARVMHLRETRLDKPHTAY